MYRPFTKGVGGSASRIGADVRWQEIFLIFEVFLYSVTGPQQAQVTLLLHHLIVTNSYRRLKQTYLTN